MKIHQKDVETLMQLQEQMNTESLVRGLAVPNLWTIMDYRYVPANSEYDRGEIFYVNTEQEIIFHTFEQLKQFIVEQLEDEVHSDSKLSKLLESNDLVDLWNHYFEHYNDHDLDEIFMKKEAFVVSDALFITEKEANEHLLSKKGKYGCYNESAYVFPLTTSSPQLKLVLNLLQSYDFSQLL